MIIHVLPGDAQAEEFSKTGLAGEVVICREAFVDGDVRAENEKELWDVREKFWTGQHMADGSEYRSRVAGEFEKLRDLARGTEVNLWFEYELFCQVNMWFCLWLLRDSPAEIFRVAPDVVNADEKWNGFGNLGASELAECFARRGKFAASDIELGSVLWRAYQDRDHARLRDLSVTQSPCFPYLKEACEAEIEKEFTPKQVLHELRKEGVEDFGEMFAAFRQRAGVYGFGDVQVRRMLEDS